MLVSTQTGRVLGTKALGAGGKTLLLYPYVDAYVDQDGKCIPYRIFEESYDSHGNLLQCPGILIHRDVEEALGLSARYSSSIRLEIPTETRDGGGHYLTLPMESFLSDRSQPSSDVNRRHLVKFGSAPGTMRGNLTLPMIDDLYAQNRENRVDYALPPKLPSGQEEGDLFPPVRVSGSMDSLLRPTGEPIYSGFFRRRQRRRLQQQVLGSIDPLSEPWYEVFEGQGKSFHLLCGSYYMENPALCVFCVSGGDNAVEAVDPPDENNMTMAPEEDNEGDSNN